jgi:hypothetical protein
LNRLADHVDDVQPALDLCRDSASRLLEPPRIFLRFLRRETRRSSRSARPRGPTASWTYRT